MEPSSSAQQGVAPTSFNIFAPPSAVSSQSSDRSQESSFNLDEVAASAAPEPKLETIEKVLTRLGLQKYENHKDNEQELEMLVGNIVENCVGTIDNEANVENYEKEFGASYKQMLKAREVKSSIVVSELNQFQKIELMGDDGLTAVIKEVRLFFKKISETCTKIVEHTLFETVILLIIILNSVKMALDDPLTDADNDPTIEKIFIVLYTLEMGVKICAFGFIFNPGSYLRDLWNILDFVIVMTSLLPYVVSISFSVNALRAIRVLRPLKTITKVKALKMIVSTLFYSFSLVMDSLYILLFVMVVFSIAGTQLFSGILKNRCIELATGNVMDQLCGSEACPAGFECGRGLSNPNFSIINFDTFLWSMLTVFQTFTLQGWSQIMVDLQITLSPFAAVYSLLIVFFCQYVLLNMTMAILKYKYAQVKGNTIEEEEAEQTQYEPQFLAKIGIFKNFTSISAEAPLQRYYTHDKIFVGSIEYNKILNQKYTNCLLDDFSLPAAASKTQNRIKTIKSTKKTKKFDLAKINKAGKIEEFKWDAKTLQFESVELNPPGALRNEAYINTEKQEQVEQRGDSKDVIEEEEQDSEGSSQFSNQDQSYDSNHDEQKEFIDQKIYQMHKKIGTTPKLLVQPIVDPESKVRQNIEVNAPKNPQPGQQTPKPEPKQQRPQMLNQVKEMNDVLGLIREAFDSTKKQQPSKPPAKSNANKIVIPEINFTDYKVDNLYERFNDLGEHRVKRVEKVNELNFFSIKQQKKHSKAQKKQEHNMVKQIAEENSLDIKQLQLVNELVKKKMKCRIKSKEALQQLQKYDRTRVLIFSAVKQETKKTQELEVNIRNMRFRLKYKQFPKDSDARSSASHGLSFRRDYDSNYKGLKITELRMKGEHEEKVKNASYKSIGGKAANYMKLLQNHKIDQKVEFEPDKIMSLFFRKEKQTRATPADKNLREDYNSTKQSDIVNRHGQIKLACPLRLPPECEEQFLEAANIKDEQYQIYIKGPMGMLTVLRKKTLLFINRPLYDNFMLLLVLFNTVVLSLNGLTNTDSTAFSDMNFIFTVAFAIDLGLKVFSYGFEFFTDIMNIFDSFVVSISIVEMTVGSVGANLSALRSVRILRAFRVLRITRLVRSLNYMKIVMSVVSSVITEFVYIFMLLALFIFIYTLLGMNLFGGQLLPESVTGIRQNFDTFFSAVFSVFQLLTTENWNDIETALLNSSASYMGILYIVSWIFIGNWILLNLLQAILLDGFDNDSSPQGTDEADFETTTTTVLPETNSTVANQTNSEDEFEDKFSQQDSSLLLFYPTTPLRLLIGKIVISRAFENIIVVIISLSSIKLVVDTYVVPGSQLESVSNTLDMVFNCIFIAECLMKIIARGFVIGPNSYLKDNWSKLDFIIVATSIIDMASEVDLSILKLFRTLRPLRIISRNLEMKIIISSLAQSMCGIINVLIIILCVFLMFGILGINLLQGKLNYCSAGQLVVNQYGPYNLGKAQCLASGGTWSTQFINFDNILNSLMSLYVFSTRENWPYYVYTLIDSSEDGPVRDGSQLLYMVFSVIIIFICSYFFMDLLVGVLFMNFHEAESKIRPKTLTDKQINWKNLQKIIIEEDPCFELYLKPDNSFFKFFHSIVTYKPFEIGITLCIFGNIVVMLLSEDDESLLKTQVLTQINFSFTIIFICEMVFKLLAFRKAYFLSGWNNFDFFVVMASVLDIILDFTGSSSSSSKALAILPQIARIFRVLRVTRLLRMFKRFKGLQKLIETFIFSFPALARGLSIVSLFLFISSVLASYLFSSIVSDYSGNFDEYRNFSNFHKSIQTLFVMTTGENWYYYMYESTVKGYVVCKQGTDCVQTVYLLFWLIYVFFSQKVFMELFVLIVLDQFESNYIRENNPLGIYALFEDDFRSNWIEITTKYNSQKIETKRLIDLLLVLKQPLGLGKRELMSKYEEQLRENEQLTEEQVQLSLKELDLKLKKNAAKLIQKMDIIKNRLYLGYHETFYRFAKLALMFGFMENANEDQRRQLDEIHRQSEDKLLEMMPKGNNYQFDEGEEAVSSQPLNPIELILFSQMIIKSWHNYSLKFHNDRNAHHNSEAVDSLNNSCSSDVAQAELERIPAEKKFEKRKGLLEANRPRDGAYEFKAMPNIDDHYQNEKKKFRKGPSLNRNSSRKSKGREGRSTISSAAQRFTQEIDQRIDKSNGKSNDRSNQ